jgi:Na+/proline symporter
MCAWFWKRATTEGALASCIIGAGAAIAWAMYAWVTTGSPGTIMFGLHAVHVGTFISIPVMIIVSLATKADPEMAKNTDWKLLGEEMKATNLIPEEDKCLKKGLFGWLGADTKGWKIFWVIMAILFVAHFVLSIGFNSSNMAVALAWVSLGVGIIMLIILAVNGGRDLSGMIKDNKAALAAQNAKEE